MTDRHDTHCPPPADIALLETWTTMHAATRRLSDALFNDIDRETGLPPSSFQALWFLLLSPDRSASMSALGRVLGFSTAGVTKLTDRLAHSDLITRTASRGDRRITLAVLTDSGADTVQNAALVLAASIKQRIVSIIGGAEFQSVAEILARAADAGTDCPSAAAGDAQPASNAK